ncbi:amidohydrolase family protein [Promethearchaeum syntrophicum]|uniref:Amidohydrolase family protein n=1 Tax=Promethearchaeum syntrophicum TaxID=2594042 RepID=A0A5B9DB86_9ARCH|nr:amidohydrolase family protein [Candidatus Prometheoarchaeum syntrophicum]QEE15896.1 Amidohydrolase [Candidatus Prometheoarchaeum syntrophicum]
MINIFAKENMEKDYWDLPATYDGPKFDAHTHIWDIKLAEKHLKYAEAFNIQKIMAILDEDVAGRLSPDLHDRFIFARFLRSQNMLSNNSNDMADMVDEYYSQGYSIIKFWFAPRWRDYVEQELKIPVDTIKLSSSLFEPIYTRIEDLGLIFLIHNSDPDLWYEKKYQPESKYGSKKNHLQDLENVLQSHPKMKVLGAHFAAQPEHLENLGRWFDTYPNFYVDASSARWMAREFSRRKSKIIPFFKRYSDRILWGTDLSFGGQARNNIPKYYFTRYLTYQVLLESNLQGVPLSFPDPENTSGTNINGLDLPLEILEKIYWKNAEKFFKKI